MDNQEHILASADIRYIETKTAKCATIVFWGMVVLSLIIGMVSGSGGISDNFGYYNWYGWFDLKLYAESREIVIGTQEIRHYDYAYAYEENILLVVVLYAVLFGILAIVPAIFKHKYKATSLTITDSQIYGTYSPLLSKKTLKMPIEKVDKLTTASGLVDKLYSGVTLSISSASGVIKLHFVQNADELIAAAMGRVKEIKEKESQIQIATPPGTSVSEKLRELVLMKDQGLITEEEFCKKREEILSQM